jgi:Tfp pilus assembly protein FimT
MLIQNNSYRAAREREAGYSILDVMITICLIGIVTSFGVIRIGVARDGLRLTGSSRILSAYLDKARLAAIRCHCSTTVQIISDSTYSVTGPIKSSTTETITLPLQENVKFQGLTLPMTITFDWRGRADNDYHLTLRNSQGSRTVDLSGGGDITVDSTADYTYTPTVQANMPTDLSDGAADSYVTSFANNNSNTPVVIENPKNHKKPKKK